MAISAKFIDKEVLALESIKEAQNPLAPIQLFSSRFDAKEVGSVNVKFPRVGTGRTATNSTDYTTGSVTIDAVSVTVAEKSLSFPLTGAELNNGITLADIDSEKLAEFLTDLTAEVTALMTAANFGASVVDTSAFTAADLPKLAVEAKGMNKVAILEPTQYALVIPTNGDALDPNKSAYGFSQGVHMADLAGDGEGFAGGKSAIAIAGGISQKWDNFKETEQHVIIQTEMGLPVLYRQFVDSTSGNVHGCFVSLFGCAVADTGAGSVMTDLA